VTVIQQHGNTSSRHFSRTRPAAGAVTGQCDAIM